MLEKFIARQPILDTKLRVFAYELLFRSGPNNVYQPYANASSSVIAIVQPAASYHAGSVFHLSSIRSRINFAWSIARSTALNFAGLGRVESSSFSLRADKMVAANKIAYFLPKASHIRCWRVGS